MSKCYIKTRTIGGLLPRQEQDCTLIGLFNPQNTRYFIEDHRFILPYPRLDIYKSSFTYAGVYAWNNLPLQLRSLSSIFSFKKALSVFLHVHK